MRRRSSSALPVVVAVVAAAVAIPAEVASAQEGRDLLSTGFTGSMSASGTESPRYALSFRSIQRLVLDAVETPQTAARVAEAVAGTPFAPDDLVRLGILEHRGDRYALAYLVLTVEDQRTIHRVAESFGAGLADAIVGRRDEFASIVKERSVASREDELLFGLVAGMLLNWDGLKLTIEMGFRPEPPTRPNGDRYQLKSWEIGADVPSEGMYAGSHTFPGPRVSFTTYGDSESIPRRKGIPDALTDTFAAGLDDLADMPTLYGALQSELIAYVSLALEDAGDVLLALVGGPRVEEDVVEATGLPAARVRPTLGLLEATGYVRRGDSGWVVSVPILTESDQDVVDGTLALGREIMTGWLETNHRKMADELAGLQAMKAGLSFDLAFNEVWHEVFGWTTKLLAERGFYVDPRAPGYRYEGYVPLVWATSLYDLR